MQATLGADQGTVEEVAAAGIVPWLDQQLDESPGGGGHLSSRRTFEEKVSELWSGTDGTAGFRQAFVERWTEARVNGEGNNPALPYKYYFRMAWWHAALSKGLLVDYDGAAPYALPDPQSGAPAITEREADRSNLVRQRIAQALSEIVVVSDDSKLELDAVGLGSFYDILYRNAFGSYATLLEEVSLHPCMGVYLSHMNNRKGDPSANIHPDENYAREIMQLFTIGLYELNRDGTPKLDAQGQRIPTYDNTDIKELARVFTGLSAATYEYEWPSARVGEDGTELTFASINGYPVTFDDDVSALFKAPPFVDMISRMALHDAYHDLEPKRLLGGHIDLPQRTAGASGEATRADISEAVQRLVAHPSTAPFIATRLIERLVTSNPLPAYVDAVAAAFGESGNLGAAVRTLLTYPLENPVTAAVGEGGTTGPQKLKSPMLRTTQLLRAFRAQTPSMRHWGVGLLMEDAVRQHPVASPTVFNFYKPDFAPHGPIEEAGAVAPEFELHNASTSIGYVNMMYEMLFGEALPMMTTVISADTSNIPELEFERNRSRAGDVLAFDFSAELALAENPGQHVALIERVSTLLTGRSEHPERDGILSVISQYDSREPLQRLWLVQTVVFLIVISAQYAVLEA